jgi:uncharacterized repeat protein (TIGR03803 family)
MSMSSGRHSYNFFSSLIAILLTMGFVPNAKTQGKETVLYDFGARGTGSYPQGPLVMDANGNLYGETLVGGRYLDGSIFELTPQQDGTWKRTRLYDFPGGSQGAYPSGGLTIDSAGSLYGLTGAGGSESVTCGDGFGCGVIFELSPSVNGEWNYTVLHIFLGNEDGYGPYDVSAPLILDQAGNLYGTSENGGKSECIDGCGTIFELNRSLGWLKSTLRAFDGAADGGYPIGNLVFDSSGNLYGTANRGGASGHGLVYELSPLPNGDWQETVLHSFSGADGDGPQAGLAFEGSNLYGTTAAGGSTSDCPSVGCGVVFELSPSASGWKEFVLHTFTGGVDGKLPEAGVTIDSAGNLYGATVGGGLSSCSTGFGSGCGAVFQLLPRAGGRWQEKVLHAFTGERDGVGPVSSLIVDSAGNLYGASPNGGAAICSYYCGLVFEITPTN